MSTKATLAHIADDIRAMYPDATTVNVFVSFHEVTITTQSHQPRKGEASYRTLCGDWAKPTTVKVGGP